MKRFVLATAAIAAIGTAIAIPVLADGNHKFSEGRNGDQTRSMGQMHPGPMMGGDMGQMMRMMQTIHGGQVGMMGPGMMGGGDHLQAIFDADKDGTVTPEELRTGMLDALKTYDADRNGTLSLDEFETMHSAHIREMTVDRFQALDADGDGQVTTEEIAAPADRMQRMMERSTADGSQGMPMIEGHDPGRGMMNDN